MLAASLGWRQGEDVLNAQVMGVAGMIVIGVGLHHMAQGASQDVIDELDLSGMSRQRQQWTRRLGVVGEVGRGIGIGLIGFFLLRAAITFNAAQATRLDGALRRLAVQSWGVLIVAVVRPRHLSGDQVREVVAALDHRGPPVPGPCRP
jgi:hypothetical protein